MSNTNNGCCALALLPLSDGKPSIRASNVFWRGNLPGRSGLHSHLHPYAPAQALLRDFLLPFFTRLPIITPSYSPLSPLWTLPSHPAPARSIPAPCFFPVKVHESTKEGHENPMEAPWEAPWKHHGSQWKHHRNEEPLHGSPWKHHESAYHRFESTDGRHHGSNMEVLEITMKAYSPL